MIITRRNLLKTLAISSLYPALSSRFADALMADPPRASKVYILLHGMFFLEFDSNTRKLVVATPQHSAHSFKTRVHKSSTLGTLDKDPKFDVTEGTNPKTSFPPEMLQFKRADVGASGPILTSASAQYRCRMILPYPDDILPLRQDAGILLDPDTATNVGKNLQIGLEIATITCLVYTPGPSGPSVTSYYAEHLKPPTCEQVNQALSDAKALCGNGFDLKLLSCPYDNACTERDDELPDGVNADDERALNEVHGPKPCTHPLKPQAAQKSQAKTPQAAKKPQKKKSQEAQHPEFLLGGDPSSCPQFGIRP